MDRIILEQSILKILKSINHPVSDKLESNLNLFSIIELSQIYEYLQTWSLNPIYDFFQKKKKDMIEIINTIKLKKWIDNLSSIKLKEKLELEQENQENEEILLNF